MTAKIIKFATESEWLEGRKNDVTSTDMAALLGLSKWKSRFALWHEKKSGIAPEFIENERIVWGRRLQNVIAHGICEDEGWKGEDLGLFYIRDESLRMGCSLDVKVECPVRGTGLFEVKNIGLDAFAAGWTEDEAPAYYETQLQLELHMANKAGLNISWGCLGALVGGNQPKLYFRDYDPEIGAMFDAEVARFWQSIEDGEEPKPDYSVDGAALARIRGAIVEKNTVDISESNRVPELIASYEQGAALEKEGKALKDAAKAEILDIIGNADKAVLPGYSITAGMVDGKEITYFREPYRNFRINKLKEKAAA
ncbi:MAG: YqaJ viral recombinase family protein [Alphaproteobacteria bacterium]|jgi:predicted phage-related endonuclease|nr:YqaJ viral recombinase family protein [Alphaproteobacteria bacterium]